jgi:preprotein translocase subunit SecG
MSFLIGLLTVVLVLNCVLLILLVLIQLPKKDAGAGLAFGGAATDALFGAGTGNVLTKVTKYAAVTFFVLAMIVSVMQSNLYHSPANVFKRKVESESKQALPGQPAVPPASVPSPAIGPEGSNALAQPLPVPTNSPTAPK